MKRRILVLQLMVGCCFSSSAQTIDIQPNIIIYLADDLGWKDVGFNGAKVVKTPNLDQLANEGMVFENAFIASPACAPSRAALLTGLMPARNGAEANHTYPKPDIEILTKQLQKNGYKIYSFGKVAHGKMNDECAWDYVNKEPVNLDKNLKEFFTKTIVDGPVCVMIGDRRPHVPWTEDCIYDLQIADLPDYFIDTKETREHRARYYSDITGFDETMGNNLSFLEDILGGNTITIMSSDHGGQWPFGKWNLYDDGIRTPLVVKWKGKIEEGKRTKAMVSWIDILPTILDLSGSETPDSLDGKSFARILKGDADEFRKEIYTTHSSDGFFNVYPIRSIRNIRYKYIKNSLPDCYHTNHSDILRKDGAGAYWDSWDEAAKNDKRAAEIVSKYYQRPAEEFYDLQTDPNEQINLIKDPDLQTEIEELRQKLTRWMEMQGDQETVFRKPYPLSEPRPDKALIEELKKRRKKKPNVLLLLVDDLKPTLGVYGDKVAHSPNIDRLAEKGMTFTHAYCNQAVCMASRYNLMLGARSTSTGLYRFGKEFRDVYPDAVTLPQYFMNAGYHTESMGKVYHIGHGNSNDEASWSIPHHKEKVIEYLLPESTNRQLTREEALFQNARKHIKNLNIKELPRGAAWESPDVLDEAYADGRVASHAIYRLRKLSTKSDQPFFMAVGFARPHLPFCVPEKYWDLYNPEDLPMPVNEEQPEGAPECAKKRKGEITQFKPVPEQEEGLYDEGLKRKLIHGYYASMSYMDAQLGRVIDELERLDLDDNTIIVLWGDHGWHLGDHGTWTKHTNFEQATRIPIIFAAPGVSQPGSKSGQLAETVDIYPTLAELAGLDKPDIPQPFDGTSLVPVLKNGEERVKDHIYHAYILQGYLGEAIRTAQYRLVRWTHTKDAGEEVLYELYDYETDPHETQNHAAENPEKVTELEKILHSHPKAKVKP